MRFVLNHKDIIRGCKEHIGGGLGCATDYKANNEPVYMPWDGTIQYWFGGSQEPGGYWISFKDKDGNSIQLAHLSQRLKHPGEFAKEGEVIAYTGNTGTVTTGPHLHLQIINTKGSRIDPATYSWEEELTIDKELHIKFDFFYEAFLGGYAPSGDEVDKYVHLCLKRIEEGHSKPEAEGLTKDQMINDHRAKFNELNAGILG